MYAPNEQRKRRAASISLAYNVVLTAIKLVAAGITGSVSLLGEAIHSATDVFASFIAFLSVRAASAPPDEEHPYGHGKIESLAGFSESVLLLFIVVYICVEAVSKLIHGSSPVNVDLGIWVMAFSCVTSLVTGHYVTRVGNETGSLALRSNGRHLMVDFWTSVGVLIALAVTRATGWTQADPIAALGLSVWIAKGAIQIAHEAFHQLIDRRVTDADVELIRTILADEPELLSYHRLRTRHSGDTHFIDLHIVVPAEWSVVRAHELADRLEKRIEHALAPAQVVIHVDPFDESRMGIPGDPGERSLPGGGL
jgi:cation diffusion facilitator family transporter